MEHETEVDFEWTKAEKERFDVINQKQTDKQFQIAFCGHFSAGKSTIINEFIGAELLPTSPIPTSANIISIRYGDLAITVHSPVGEKEHWIGSIPWDQVSEWGRDGTGIKEISIYAPLSFLQHDAALYDTPGVDSTDPSHQSITLEALYGMDLIVYVMDYNHVQSETNLYFLKQLSEEKKPLFIIINQVDKHDETELAFTEFDESVQAVFEQWNIQFVNLLYTSMKQKDHALNQFSQFEAKLKAIMHKGRDLAEHSVTRLKQGFYLSQAARLLEEKEEEVEELVDVMREQGLHESQLTKQEELMQEQAQLQQAKQTFIETFEKEWESLFKQVTIFPATTTDLARSWLESMEPSFKMGILFSKKKTEEERTVRLHKLIQETQDKVNRQLVFHLQQSIDQIERHTLTNTEEVDEKIKHLSFQVTADFFSEHVKSGPKNREYVYTFTKERTTAIIRKLRERAYDVLHSLAKGQEQHWYKQLEQVNVQLDGLEEVQAYADQLHHIQQKYNQLMRERKAKADSFKDGGLFDEKLAAAQLESFTSSQEPIQWEPQLTKTEEMEPTEPSVSENLLIEVPSLDKSWIDPLKKRVQAFAENKVLQHERTQLINRMTRVQNQSFVISLFGAFSAGKSSFANALLGEQVLPVSPHPTTATISTVMRSDSENANGTARVQVKSTEDIAEEIRVVASKLDVDVTLESLHQWKRQAEQNMTGWQKNYTDYLATLQQSLNETEWQLGQTFAVTHADLQDLVAKEQAACLIHSVTVYQDSDLTTKGLILVDTPGVNSIHGRHTNVAFNQLRKSDAIFYVTYYNHAFSKSDQLFLEQIGKINESFEHDKLYYLINASDLASTSQELQGVKTHVINQLHSLGIKNPRLFAVSSKEGLLAKQQNKVDEYGFSLFEQYLYEQIVQQLETLSIQLLAAEKERYVSKIVESLDYAQKEKHEQQQAREQLLKDVERWKIEIQSSSTQSIERKMKQEATELFLYLRERTGYRMRDDFSEHINVATIRGKGKKEKRSSLEAAIIEWAQEAEYFLEQECKATHIRLDEAMNRAARKWLETWEKKIQQERHSFYVQVDTKVSETDNHVPECQLTINPKDYTSFYANDKAFFEGQEIRVLKEKLIHDGAEVASVILLKEEELTMTHIYSSMTRIERQIKDELVQVLEREIDQLDMLTNEKTMIILQKELEEIQEK
ncbi:dynamin family protein [Alkalicoccobacillus porphyridii]|uniref:Dynamin N-terminal domain-containing protein n=1 Tax=Alkalicoccobacillus porphyridii TaxID=2597270 RepID=A0A553ZZV1_9BACI|nr:dynamin family protein [Alkalicoccobacillus porphyridii]TSB46955.1 hypothetical protein FN960_08010 [Alkalicoccobacillus porphyridii]